MTSASPHQGREPVASRLSRLRSAVALAVLLLLLGVVAAASGGGEPVTGQETDAAVPDALVDYAFTLAIVVFVVIAVGSLLVLSQARRVRVKHPTSRRALLVGFVVILVAVTAARALRPLDPPPQEEPARPPAVTKPESGQRDVAPTKGQDLEFRWEVALVVGVAALAALAYAFRRWSKDELETGPDEAALAVSAVLDEALDDLRAERDARRAVIAAYARLEGTLAHYGLPRRPSEAPLEYLSRILLELEVTPEAVLDLTDLFEQAKFSLRRIDATMKDEAIDALVAVRDDLRVAA